ncbi:MAG: hypothetical protein KAI66_00495 [Lentisphaeria bacterium]|nr:hypothetical protein [Lentisphaeria bacterium]
MFLWQAADLRGSLRHCPPRETALSALQCKTPAELDWADIEKGLARSAEATSANRTPRGRQEENSL